MSFATCVRNKWKELHNIVTEAEINALTYQTLLFACSDVDCEQQAFVHCVGDKDVDILSSTSLRSLQHVAQSCETIQTDRVLVSVFITSALLFLILFVHVILQLSSLNKATNWLLKVLS